MLLRALAVRLGLLIALAHVPLAAIAQAPVAADAFVSSVQPERNFGGSVILPVQAEITSFIRFDLGMLPAKPVIAKATLRLYVSAVLSPGSFDIYPLQNGWSEVGVTFNRAPGQGPSITGGRSVSLTSASRNQYVLVDITSLAQAWADGTLPNNGIALALSSTVGSFAFDSKESRGHAPELDFVLGVGQSESTPLPAGAAVGRLEGLSAPPPGPSPYINNQTTQQTGANFNIDGNGTAGSFNSASTYQIGGTNVFNLGAPGDSNLFLGANAGLNNVAGVGQYNVFAGAGAGGSNTTGVSNMFLGTGAGQLNTSGSYNTFIGTWSGAANTTGHHNILVGTGAGAAMTTGQFNTIFGVNAGLNTTTASQNTFFGGSAGQANTTGSVNVFFGIGAGESNTTGSSNVYIGPYAGYKADATSSNNIYLGTQGAAGESNTVRLGDQATQTAAYIAGVNGAATSSGMPVFIDATGKLGTGGGTVSFSQVSGTLTNPQLTGTYTNQVMLSNSTNVFNGTFSGSGSGLTGVASGLSWPIVIKSANYTVQLSDFSTPSTAGNFVIATGAVSLTFTLPNPAPSNGQCVAIGNVIDAGINSNANAYLTVNGNGLQIDATSAYVSTHPRRANYLYCSDGTGYYRLGYVQNGVSEIGPWLKTVDTGTVNAYQTTFRNGMDFGLSQGSMIVLQVLNANTSTIPTLNVNGLGAKKILRYGNQALAPGDLNPNAFALLIYDGAFWELLNPQTINGTVTAVTATAPLVSTGGVVPNISCPSCNTTQALTGSTGTIGGAALSAGTCTSGTASVAGAVIGHPVSVSASDGSLPDGLTILSAAVTSSGTVTVQLCAVANNTPAAKIYNIATQ